MAKPRKKTVKVKKKSWITIFSPQFLNKVELGECYVESPEKMIGKHVKINLSTLVNDYKKQKYGVEFIVINANSEEANTKICGFRTRPLTLKTMVRKGHDRIDHRIIVKTTDNQEIIVKPILVTKNNVPNSVKTNLRSSFVELLNEKMKSLKTDEFFSQLIALKLQRDIKKELAKVYPLKALEVKIALLVLPKEILGETKQAEEPVEEPVKAAEKPVEEVVVEEEEELFDDDTDKEEE